METIQVNASQRNSVSGYIQLFSSMDDKKKQQKKNITRHISMIVTHITDSHIPEHCLSL